jgi:ABC-type sugar transport system permease subunit
MAIPTVFVLGMIVALSLSVVRRGAALLRIIIYFPTLQASLIVALIWTFVIHPDFGLLNLGIRALTGVKLNFLGDPHFAMPTIAMIEVWKGLGFWAILFLSGLLALPDDLYHAAELDGAGPIRRFFSLTLPLMKPTLCSPFSPTIVSTLFGRVRSDRRQPGRPRDHSGTSTAASSPSPIRASARRCPSCLSSSFSR